MKQKRMALYTDCLSKAMRGIVAKHLKGYMPEQQFDIKNIMQENNNERVRSFNCSKQYNCTLNYSKTSPQVSIKRFFNLNK